MEFTFRVKDKIDYLIFELDGDRSRRTNAKVADAIRDACASHSCKRVLVDALALENRLGVLDAHAGPTTDFPRDVASKQIKVAVVDRKEFASGFRFFETVARNAGYFLRVFIDREAAIKWLLSEDIY